MSEKVWKYEVGEEVKVVSGKMQGYVGKIDKKVEDQKDCPVNRYFVTIAGHTLNSWDSKLRKASEIKVKTKLHCFHENEIIAYKKMEIGQQCLVVRGPHQDETVTIVKQTGFNESNDRSMSIRVWEVELKTGYTTSISENNLIDRPGKGLFEELQSRESTSKRLKKTLTRFCV